MTGSASGGWTSGASTYSAYHGSPNGLVGFDGLEPDNIDGFLNDTGFPLPYDDQLEYNI